MSKLMYAARAATEDRASLHAALLAPDLRDRLAAGGARRLQVNVDDGPVADALRIPAQEPGVAAIVSVWLDDDAASAPIITGITRVLTDLGHEWDGWQVEERLPIPPPAGQDGVRMDTLANIAMLRRPGELAHEEWLHRWLVDHTPVAIGTQGTFGYLQNVVVAEVVRGTTAPPVAALVEELFPMVAMTDIHAFYGSGGDDAELTRRINEMMASVARFGADRDLDLVPTSRYTFAW